MTFAFLYPLAWLGTLAVGVPIWLHLRQKFQSNVVKFSALRFLDDQPLVRRSPLRLRDLLLFTLRVLGVFLLVAAFAWPYRREAVEAVATESRIYVLDNTLSHQALQGVEKARDRILAEISDLGAETQVAVIELTDQPRMLIGFGDSRESARQRLQALTPSAQRGSYLAAFRQANTALANSLGRDKRIMFYGDSQQNQWAEQLNPPPFLQDVKVEIAEAPADDAPNLWLSAPRWERMHLADKTVVDFAVELHHQGDIKSATVSLSANDQEILSREMELTVEQETMTLTGRWDVDPTQWIRGEVSVVGTPDALAADNRVFFSIPPVREGTVLLLAQSPFLRAALSPDVMRGRWSSRWMEPSELADPAATPDDADVLVVESSYLQADKVRDLVLGYLNGGRGVLLLCNRVAPLSNGFLRELGFEPQPADPNGQSPTSFRYVFGEHPVFQPFMAPDFGNLLEVDVYRYQRLRSSRAMPLVFSKTGDALFFQGTSTRGKLFVSAFGFDRSETNWPLHPTFVPFLDLCLRNAQAEDATPTTFEPGEICVLDLPGDANVREVVLRSGDGELARVAVVDGRAKFPVPGSPGSYEVRYDGDQEVQRMLSVNPSPLESKLIHVDATDAVKIWQVDSADNKPAARAAGTTMARSRLSIMQQRLWWWLLAGGLGAVVVETVWLASRKERV